MRTEGARFQPPPSELMVAVEPTLPAFDASEPMPLNVFVGVVAEDAFMYQHVAARYLALQEWLKAELKRIEEVDAAQ